MIKKKRFDFIVWTIILVLLAGCSGKKFVTIDNIEEIKGDDSLVILRVAKKVYSAPSPMMGGSNKEIELTSNDGEGHFICKVMSPGIYSIYTREFGIKTSSDTETRKFLEANKGIVKDLYFPRQTKRELFYFEVPKGKLIDLGTIKITPQGYSKQDKFPDKAYETQTWSFSLQRTTTGINALKRQHPQIYNKFSKNIHFPIFIK